MPDTITVAELVLKMNAAMQRMGLNNPHRLLMQQAADALVYLANKVPE